jgi:hypothetical protein
VIVGIRPEHFEDAMLVDDRHDGQTFKATVDVLESVGSEYYAHFTLRSEPLPAVALGAVIPDRGSADSRRFRDGVPMVARLGRASQVRQGDEAELWFDITQIHLFDDHGGQNLLANEHRANGLAPPPGARALTRGSGPRRRQTRLPGESSRAPADATGAGLGASFCRSERKGMANDEIETGLALPETTRQS